MESPTFLGVVHPPPVAVRNRPSTFPLPISLNSCRPLAYFRALLRLLARPPSGVFPILSSKENSTKAVQKGRQKMKTKSIIAGIIRLTLLALWSPVAVEKLWDLSGFHSTLRRQPIPEWSTDILFWLLPLAELGAAALIAWPRSRKRTHQGMWLSAILMLSFTLFIGFGVLGWYEKRPCGCGSVISGLSWDDHLWFNAIFFLLAVLGIWLTCPALPGSRRRKYQKAVQIFRQADTANDIAGHFIVKRCLLAFAKRFPRKFALFRRRAL